MVNKLWQDRFVESIKVEELILFLTFFRQNLDWELFMKDQHVFGNIIYWSLSLSSPWILRRKTGYEIVIISSINNILENFNCLENYLKRLAFNL